MAVRYDAQVPALHSLVLAAAAAALTTASTNSPGPASGGAAVSGSNTVDKATGFAVGAPSLESPVEQAYERLLEQDDAAQEEIDQWIREADAQGASVDAAALQKRINERVQGVMKAYGEFLEKYPGHARGRVAFGSFLSDTGQENMARVQWEKALELDPKNPAVYNNLAGLYGHQGPITNAFRYFEKAIELAPSEPVYYQNLATTVFLFRKDVKEHYGLQDEQQVFDKALGLYKKAMALDPSNFILAADTAQTYYGIKPPRYDEALLAWKRAQELAGDDLEREGVRVHLARILVQAGRYDEARTHLGSITNANFQTVKERIEKTMDRRIQGEKPSAEDEEKELEPKGAPVKFPGGAARGDGR